MTPFRSDCAGKRQWIKRASQNPFRIFWNLPLQVASRPIALRCFGFVRLVGGVIFHPHQGAVV